MASLGIRYHKPGTRSSDHLAPDPIVGPVHEPGTWVLGPSAVALSTRVAPDVQEAGT